MTLQTLIPFVPFLALLYVVFALVQTLRHKRQGNAASLLALFAVVAPLAAYLLTSDAAVQANLLTGIAVNAIIVFIASLVSLLIERRSPTRDPNHSFGILGIGLSLLLAVTIFAAPLIPTGSASVATVSTTDISTAASNTTDTVLISAVTPGAVVADSSGSGAFPPPLDGTPGAPMNPLGNPPAMPLSDGSARAQTTDEAASAVDLPQAEPTTVATEAPTETVVRPTQIAFPTSMPTSEAAEATEAASALAESVSSAATCALVVDFNLNLRTLPTTEGSTVLLSIPFATSVLSDSRTSDDWYHVSYDGQVGWVSGQYVTAGAGCDALTIVTAS